MNSTDTKPGYGVAVISAMLLSGAASSSCDFDTDDADGPDFLDKIIECGEELAILEHKITALEVAKEN